MTKSVQPADLKGLTLRQLVAAEEYKMLAGLAKLGGGQSVVSLALSELAAIPQCFSWWWASVREYPYTAVPEWNSAGKLPDEIEIPGELVDEVSDFIATPHAGNQGSVIDSARVNIFRRLKRGAVALAIARRIADQRSLPDLQTHAIELLGKSKVKADREMVMAAARRGRPNLAVLAELEPPLTPDEEAAIRDALSTVLGNLQPPEPTHASILLSRLAPSQATTLLPRNPASHATIAAGLVAQLGPALRSYLEELVIDADDKHTQLAKALSAHVGSIRDHEDQLTTAEWILQTYPSDFLRDYIGTLSSRASSPYGRDDATRSDLLRLLVASPTGLLVAAYGASATIADLADWDFDLSSEANRALGKAFAHAIKNGRLSAETLTDAIATAVDQHQAGPATLIGGLVQVLPETPERLADTAVLTPEGFAQLALAKDVQAGVAAMKRVGAQTGGFVAAVVATSAALPLDEDDRGLANGVVQGLLDELELAALTEQAAVQLSGELRRRPSVLRNLLFKLMATLRRPQASHASGVVLARVMEVIRDLGEFEGWTIDQNHDEDTLVTELAHHGDPVVRALAATWLGQAPPTDQSLNIAIAAAAADSTPQNPFGAACAQIATTLVATAADISASAPKRVSALENAQRADEAIARKAALDLKENPSTELRLAAASVLANTPGTSQDLEILEVWYKDEHNSQVKSEVATALRRLRSGSVGDALHNLLAHFGLTANFKGLDAKDALPYPQWHDAFVENVDTVRSSATASAKDAVQAHILLADLSPWAPTHWRSKDIPKFQDLGQKILDDDPKKQTSGALITNQQLVIELPWMHSFAALRQNRNAHPKPNGSTPATPGRIQRRMAHDLTRDVVIGWATVMLGAGD
jgi:hypothetical protein